MRNSKSKEEYLEYLESDEWFQFKKFYSESDVPHFCLICGSPLYQIHHLHYAHVGNEKLRDVVPLCKVHHFALHDEHRKLASKVALKKFSLDYIADNKVIDFTYYPRKKVKHKPNTSGLSWKARKKLLKQSRKNKPKKKGWRQKRKLSAEGRERIQNEVNATKERKKGFMIHVHLDPPKKKTVYRKRFNLEKVCNLQGGAPLQWYNKIIQNSNDSDNT